MKATAFSLCCLVLSGMLTLKGTNVDVDPKDKTPLDGWVYWGRVGGDLVLVLKSTQDPYNVHISGPAPFPNVPGKKRGYFVEGKAGFLFGPQQGPDKKRFEFKEFRSRVVQDPVLGEKNQSLMIIYDRVLQENLDLFYNLPINVSGYQAKLQYRKGDHQPVIEASLNEVVHLPDAGGPAYRIIDIQKDQVIFSPVKADGTVDEKVKLVLNKDPGQPPPSPAPVANELRVAIPVPGKPGFVFSPYDPNAGMIDVQAITPGTKVRDPYTDNIFLVP